MIFGNISTLLGSAVIVSHKHQYLFVEIPLTGSWAIRCELLKYYDGQPILHKHANYIEFKRIATPNELHYFKFATVRNPLDEAVSEFLKVEANHKGVYSDRQALSKMEAIDYADLAIYRYIQRSKPTFESYLLRSRLWDRPHSSMIDVSAPGLDYVMRFENLNDDFLKVLKRLGLDPVRPVPVKNRTLGRKADWRTYYTPQMIDKVKRVYGPFMQRWEYPLPSDWGENRVSEFRKFQYHLSIIMKRIYLTHFRYSDSFSSKLVRKLNAVLKGGFYR
jgi:hypothetical protein